MSKRETQEQLEQLYSTNAFGDIDDWMMLDEGELEEECQSMLKHFSQELKWDVSQITAQDMAEFLKAKWVE